MESKFIKLILKFDTVYEIPAITVMVNSLVKVRPITDDN